MCSGNNNMLLITLVSEYCNPLPETNVSAVTYGAKFALAKLRVSENVKICWRLRLGFVKMLALPNWMLRQ